MRDKYEFIRYSSDPSQQLMEDLFKIAQRQGVGFPKGFPVHYRVGKWMLFCFDHN